MTIKTKQVLKGFAIFILAGICVFSLFSIAGYIIVDKEVSAWNYILFTVLAGAGGFGAVKLYRS
ncbi:hypothetical protein [Christiangramia forsetii]|uniref:Membrane protein n=2 Tax=Christiangramia forsetii TaxID=411153 RepID=A0M426_CHRFK|nr:hypothetical protein [Christiangramia forsetii]GGG24395.1 hypothetical protein GCM10011532_04570 [Christiangramia forsetii]CAL67371.1 membrane protein [Christiangramia forsetii KT0803]